MTTFESTQQPCDHPRLSQVTQVFRTAVPRDHPGYSENRKTICHACGTVIDADE